MEAKEPVIFWRSSIRMASAAHLEEEIGRKEHDKGDGVAEANAQAQVLVHTSNTGVRDL